MRISSGTYVYAINNGDIMTYTEYIMRIGQIVTLAIPVSVFVLSALRHFV